MLATDAGPATVLTATDIYRWLPGRHFIVHDVDARFGSTPARSMEVIGYDQAVKKYIARSFDDKGTFDSFEVALTGTSWKISGASMQFDGVFSQNGNKLAGLWELKSSTGVWQPWINLELYRA